MAGEASKINLSRMNKSKTNLALKATCDGEIRLAPSSIIPLPDAARYVIVMGFEVIILSSIREIKKLAKMHHVVCTAITSTHPKCYFSQTDSWSCNGTYQ